MIYIVSQSSGLKFLLALPTDRPKETFIQQARDAGVLVYDPGRFWQREHLRPSNLIQIGFTSIEPEDIPACMALLDAAWFGTAAHPLSPQPR